MAVVFQEAFNMKMVRDIPLSYIFCKGSQKTVDVL